MERQIGQNYLDIWFSPERLSALKNVRVNVFERIIIVHANAELYERSRERSHERLCERTYLPSLSC